jgi:hypothetical protein
MINPARQYNMTSQFPFHGLPETRLHIVIQRFCFFEVTKPAHEHDLQALPALPQALFLMT